jgi:methanogenic corrinoid protein MtbC1
MSREDEVRQGLFDGTLYGRAPQVKALTEEALAMGMAPLDILFGPLIPALEEVGKRFEIGEYFVPEMIISAKAMQAALKLLRPLLAQTGSKPIGKVVIATVKVNIEALTKAGLRDKLKVMVGGAPVTQDYATKMGADGYAATASATVHVAKALRQSMGYDISGGATVSAETKAAVGAMEQHASCGKTCRARHEHST